MRAQTKSVFLLGLCHKHMQFSGTVVHGTKHGSSIGYPTINIQVTPEITRLFEREGVYAVRVSHDALAYAGVLFWGKRSLFNEKTRVCEILLLDFSGDLYTEKVQVKVGEFIREAKVVSTNSELRDLIAEDIEKAREVFKSRKAIEP